MVVRWRGLWRDVEVHLGPQRLGVIPDGRALRAGAAFTLLDGTTLAVRLRLGRGLVVTHEGVVLATPTGMVSISTTDFR